MHGGWFSRVLQKVLDECAPDSRVSWAECVIAAHCKNELAQVYGMTPAQFVFGRNPRVPSNLVDEPLEVVPATAAAYEEAVARSVALRQAARKALSTPRRQGPPCSSPSGSRTLCTRLHGCLLENAEESTRCHSSGWSLLWSGCCLGVCRQELSGCA